MADPAPRVLAFSAAPRPGTAPSRCMQTSALLRRGQSAGPPACPGSRKEFLPARACWDGQPDLGRRIGHGQGRFCRDVCRRQAIRRALAGEQSRSPLVLAQVDHPGAAPGRVPALEARTKGARSASDKAASAAISAVVRPSSEPKQENRAAPRLCLLRWTGPARGLAREQPWDQRPRAPDRPRTKLPLPRPVQSAGQPACPGRRTEPLPARACWGGPARRGTRFFFFLRGMRLHDVRLGHMQSEQLGTCMHTICSMAKQAQPLIPTDT